MSNTNTNPMSHPSLSRRQEKPLLRRRIWKKIIDRMLTPVVQFLYRSRFKRVIGGTMVVLTHAGRRTGKIRKTVLYAKNNDAQSKVLMLVSAFGVTDWFLNISKQPALLVQVGDVKYVPEQKILTAEEIAALERCFRRKHPVVARAQAWLMGCRGSVQMLNFLLLPHRCGAWLFGLNLKRQQNCDQKSNR